MMSKYRATQKGNALVKRLKKKLGGNWKLRIHENLGWHFTAYIGTISVFAGYNGEGNYSTLISDGDYPMTGLSAWTENNYNSKPELSVKKAIKDSENYVNKLQKIINLNKKKLGGKP